MSGVKDKAKHWVGNLDRAASRKMWNCCCEGSRCWKCLPESCQECYNAIPKPSRLETIVCCHAVLQIAMLICGGFLLHDIFSCPKCLYFSLGVDHEASVSSEGIIGKSAFSESWSSDNGLSSGEIQNDTEASNFNEEAYTGTVRNILARNARIDLDTGSFTDNCGIWVLHPMMWDKTPGLAVEQDVTFGQETVGIKGSVSDKKFTPVQPLTGKDTLSKCKVNIGDDSTLRDGDKVLTQGSCRYVSVMHDEQVGVVDFFQSIFKKPSHFAFHYRGVCTIIGLLVYILIRVLQYVALFQAVGSDEKPSAGTSNSDGYCEKCLQMVLKALQGVKAGIAASFDYIFYSQFPALVIEPLMNLKFMGECNSVVTFNFHPGLWFVGSVLAFWGVCVHGHDLLLKTRKTEKSIVMELWVLFMGFILSTFVLALKVILILRLGWSLAFSFKAEWAFEFAFWPLTVAIELDLFQIIAMVFFAFDLFIFGPFTAYVKFLCDEQTKHDEGGFFGSKAAAKVSQP